MCFSVIPCTTGTETYEKMQLQSVLVDLISPHSLCILYITFVLCISHKYKCKKNFIILFFCFDCRIDRLSKSKSGLLTQEMPAKLMLFVVVACIQICIQKLNDCDCKINDLPSMFYFIFYQSHCYVLLFTFSYNTIFLNTDQR